MRGLGLLEVCGLRLLGGGGYSRWARDGGGGLPLGTPDPSTLDLSGDTTPCRMTGV